jgi:drug/metabolite transporter (DMT)-like permease
MPRAIAIVQTLSILILISLGTVLAKLALSDVAPLTFAWLSVAVGIVVLSFYTFIICRERVPRGLGKQVWAYIIAIGICNFVVVRIGLTLALERLPATTQIYLVNFVGFITMAMSIFILKEAPTIFQLLGAVVAFSGLRVFFAQIPSAYELVGVGLILVAITALAYTNNIARKLALITNFSLSNSIISTMALLTGGSITVLIGLIVDWPPQVAGWQNWAIILYAGIIMVGLSMTVWNYILRTLRSYEASILGASTVIWTALLAIPILGEQLSFTQSIGIGLMIVGLSLVQVRRGRLDTLWRRISQTTVES